MTRSQRAFYLIVAAVMQQLVLGIRDPETRRSTADVVNWIAFWLSQEDLDFLERMGFLIDMDEEESDDEDDTAPGSKATDLDDDIPF